MEIHLFIFGKMLTTETKDNNLHLHIMQVPQNIWAFIFADTI